MYFPGFTRVDCGGAIQETEGHLPSCLLESFLIIHLSFMKKVEVVEQEKFNTSPWS